MHSDRPWYMGSYCIVSRSIPPLSGGDLWDCGSNCGIDRVESVIFGCSLSHRYYCWLCDRVTMVDRLCRNFKDAENQELDFTIEIVISSE